MNVSLYTYVAAAFGHYDYVKMLIERSVNFDEPCGYDGEFGVTPTLCYLFRPELTPFYLAAVNGYVECAKLLFNAGADVNRIALPYGPEDDDVGYATIHHLIIFDSGIKYLSTPSSPTTLLQNNDNVTPLRF